MRNTQVIQLKDFYDEAGHLTPIESMKDIPFEIKRIYYITQVPNDIRRGFHSHRDLHQLLICVNGSVDILLNNAFEKTTVKLDNATKGLYIGPMIWREMHNFSEQAVLLVLASEHHNTDDYIRDYNEYVKLAQAYFGGPKND